MRKLNEREAVARLKRGKVRFQTHVKLNYEHRALSCRACPTPGVCCTDAHFVNVHITRLEAVAIRDTLARTPRLNEDERRAVYARAHEAVNRYGLAPAGDTFAQTFSCPLFAQGVGCLVHTRAARTGRTCRRSTGSGAKRGGSNGSTRRSTARPGSGCRCPSGSRS